MSLHLNIETTGGNIPAYAGVVVTRTGGKEVMRWMTGNPPADWAAYLDWASEQAAVSSGFRILEGSSITHFLHDVPGWRMIEDEDGHEIIVPEDRPAWLAIEAEERKVTQPTSLGQ